MLDTFGTIKYNESYLIKKKQTGEMKMYKLKQFTNLDKWMAAGENHELVLRLRKAGPCWELLDSDGLRVGQIFVGETFSGKPMGWMTVPVVKKSA